MIERTRRSTLRETSDGRLYRQYHDTERVSECFAAHLDPSGARRCSGNRRIDHVREGTARGVVAPPPAHLQRALGVICRRSNDIRVVATLLNVTRNTAWSYVCRVVDAWPTSCDCAALLVDPDLMEAVRATPDLAGSLRDLMDRLPPSAHHALRAMDDRYAHLRLARLCVEAERSEGARTGRT